MLNDRLGAYLTYVERLATQQPNRWDGFFLSQREEGYFGLRFQIAFSCYALGALCRHPDADDEEQRRCRRAMEALIARMLQRRVWAYWGQHAERRGIVADPVIEDNVQYSAMLAMMIGVYEAAGGDERYDDDFVLLWNSEGRFTYTHTTLVEAIWRQMRAHEYHGVASEPNCVSPAHNSHALWALLLHDALHRSSYAEVNQQWLDFLASRLTFGGPVLPGRGVFSATYFPRSRLRALTGSTFLDAWTLALLAPIAPDLIQRLAPRLLRQVRHTQENTAFVPSAKGLRSKELADLSASTGFGYLLAIEQGDDVLAQSLLRYADTYFQPREGDDGRFYDAGIAEPYTTALFALGEAGGLGRLLRASEQDVPRADTETLLASEV